jgi:hypothetical protein
METKGLFLAREFPPPGGNNQLMHSLSGTDRYRLTDHGRQLLVSRVSGLFTSAPRELRRLKNNHPEIRFDFDHNRSLKFQLTTLLIVHPRIAFTRQDLQAFVDRLGLHSGDVIQSVNKTPQWGLQRWRATVDGQTFYSLPSPLQFDNSKLQLRQHSGRRPRNKQPYIRAFRDNIDRTFCQDPNWAWGHRDPQQGDGGGIVLQPASYNRAYRDRYKFDDQGLKDCPTVNYLLQDPDKFYSRQELEALRDGLSQLLSEQGR